MQCKIKKISLTPSLLQQSSFTLIVVILLGTIFQPPRCSAEDGAEIGAIVELSGPHAINGEQCKQGIEVAKELFSSAVPFPTALLYGDSRGEPAVGVTEFHRLAEEKNLLAIILNRTQVGMAVNPLSKQQQLPLLALAPHPHFTIDNPYAFLFWPSAIREGSALVDAIHFAGVKTLAIITLEDQYSLALRERVLELAPTHQQTIVADERVTADTQDFRSVVQRILKTSPTGVFVNVGVAQGGTVIRQLREQGFHGLLFGNYWMSLQGVIDTAGVANIEDLVYFEAQSPGGRFTETYSKLFPNQIAPAPAGTCFFAAATVFNTLAEFHTPPSREEFYLRYNATSSYSIEGRALTIKDREAQIPLQERIIHDGKRQAVIIR